MKYKKLKLSVEIFVILLIICPLINAFGVTTFYWDEQPLIMHPGETKDVDLLLQNMVGDKDIKVKAELVGGSEIATLIDSSKEYLVPLGEKDVKVNIRVKIPEDTPLDSRYDVMVMFKELAQGEGKMIQISGAVGGTIPVVVKSASKVPVETIKPVEQTKSSSLNFLWALIIIIIVIIGIIITFKKKK